MEGGWCKGSRLLGNEKEQEGSKTAGAFFVGGILSFLLSLVFYEAATPLIGALAAIFTLSAIVMLIKPLTFSILFFMPKGLVAILYFVYNAIAVYSGTEDNVAYIAHIIGFALGIPLWLGMEQERLKNLLITIAMLAIYFIVVAISIPIILGTVS